MKQNGKSLLILGCALFSLGIALLLLIQVHTMQSARENAQIIQIMEVILTDRREGTIDLDYEEEMPALELHGEDFVAMLEIPSHGLKLPVSNTWDKEKIWSYPCRFFGTAYNGTLVIGGCDQAGQFDFFDHIQDGAEVTVTDMTGSVFSYLVDRVERSSSVEVRILADTDTDLILFVRDAQLLEYIIVRCVMK